MKDVRVNNEYCVVSDIEGNIVYAEFMDQARIETRQNVQVFKTLQDIEKSKIKLPEVEGMSVEKNKLYNHKGKIICPKISGHLGKMKDQYFKKDKD